MCHRLFGGWHFFMYLVKLYKKNKTWFVVVVLFLFGQLFINYKNGLMVSPFFNYDMYSQIIVPRRKYEVTQVKISGKLLEPKDFSLQEWDNLMQPIFFFETQKDWNHYNFYSGAHRFLGSKDTMLFMNNITAATFNNWYKQQALHIAHIADTTSKVTIIKDTVFLAQPFFFFK